MNIKEFGREKASTEQDLKGREDKCSITSAAELEQFTDQFCQVWLVTVIFALQFRLRWSQRPCNVEYSSSYSSSQVQQLWAKSVLGMETAGELLMMLAWVQILTLLRGDLTVLVKTPNRLCQCPYLVESSLAVQPTPVAEKALF